MRVGAIALAVIAWAQPAAAQWTASAYLGGAATGASQLTIRQPAANTDVVFDPVRFRGESFEFPLYYGYRIGHRAGPPWLSLEAEFVHLKVYAETQETASVRGLRDGVAVDRVERIDETVERFSLSHGMNLLLFNAVARRPLHRHLDAVVRGGAGPTIPHVEATVRGAARESYDWGRAAWQVAAGLEAGGDRVRALVEYKLTRTRQRVTIEGGDAETVLRTHHLVAGLGVRF